jgi:hypothetical protein
MKPSKSINTITHQFISSTSTLGSQIQKKKKKRKNQKTVNPANKALKIPQHCYFDTEIVRIPAIWLTNCNHNVETQRNTPI